MTFRRLNSFHYKGDERWGRYRRGADTYVSGDWYIQCDRCGFKTPRSIARKTWDNLLVCPYDWEPRHPQDYIRTIKDQQAVPEPRSEGEDTFLDTNEVKREDL